MNDTISNKVAINKALQVLNVFRQIDPDLPMGAAVSFLLIANGQSQDGGGLTVTELKNQGGFALSSASRYQRALGVRDRQGRPGKDLIKDTEDPTDARRKVLRLTAKGNLVAASVRLALGV